MTIRSTTSTVTFNHPFSLRNAERPLPAGTYRLVTDEEPILGVSFIAYRRTAMMLHTPAVSMPQGRSAILSTDQSELDAALQRDRAWMAGPDGAPQ